MERQGIEPLGSHPSVSQPSGLQPDDGAALLSLSVSSWRRGGESNPGSPVDNRASCHWTTAANRWLPDQDSNLDSPVTAGCPAVGRSGKEGSEDGAWSRFRARLSASSLRRCHQTSYPGLLCRLGNPRRRRRSRSTAPVATSATEGPALRRLRSRQPKARRHAGCEVGNRRRDAAPVAKSATEGATQVARPRGIEPLSARGQRAALPLSYGRKGHGRDWRKADGSNATPRGAHPLSKRVAGHSSGAFH